ncbi:MAG: formylglycine-generating enzyme family protein [Phycisphaerales bacterium]|nr:formylglycine-generating enzyme family protein [Phycisphaerales bacterium]
MMPARVSIVASMLLLSAPAAIAQLNLPPAPRGVEVTTSFGIEFSTVSSRSNRPWIGGPNDYLSGRGVVPYDYRIARTEITTAQWMEFVNAFSEFGDPHRFEQVAFAGFWGAPGPFGVELNPFIPNAANMPVIGVSWRNAARYCNWLHNGKQNTLAALESGAYDTSTFGRDADRQVTDQVTRSPGARFWIPSFDEWMKAAYYDPARFGANADGWWQYPNSTDTPLISGIPGIGQTSGGIDAVTFNANPVALAAYSDQMSPWGLLDASGGGADMTEEVLFSDFFFARGTGGSWARQSASLSADRVGQFSDTIPEISSQTSLRIATVVPTPGAGFGAGTVLCLCAVFRRRRR